MKPHWLVKTENRELIIKCDSIGEAQKVANTMPDQNPVIEYVRNIGGITVSTPVEIETK
jgi:hypothetical protein